MDLRNISDNQIAIWVVLLLGLVVARVIGSAVGSADTRFVAAVLAIIPASIGHQPDRAAEIRQSQTRIASARLSLEWRPWTCLEAGLKQLATIPTLKPCTKK